ncbi:MULTISPECIES: NUDIX domain-containing protein [Clostridium]|jgi:ADP-ribose pyrophosphatase|uniref:ADP-ribose pyrophosphatase YjhB (NUDIX family) n=3 Tax=Clostridium beijerinckii TaxID=1520 RepID=A0A0B5QFG5_CLOBE|nr:MULTISPECIES: NUDIX hydrolase [Clostridium]ABR34570.1 NUDIX hydrolase [Clostridium beijerinckii NCIMB 8052]AIU02940.1 NUDIX hydrolase [Clostridium beijerinckii ATCC 35702]AJG99685.1 NUDIX hydrolase [Clostridium beijerinckii]AQS05154.1 RNA pyrophosphohydrolase [Clostridium beijerinckii]MBA2886974.1 ADP-ribose pyrophosphatase YjhB (NUDIX family) [Clostridium beijerinckii]
MNIMFNKLFEIDKVSDSIEKINFREAVRGIIIKDKKILMVHSKNKDYKFPGGGMKKDEGHIDALKREVEEETGYVCSKIGDQLGIITERSKDKYVNNRVFKMISYYYLAEVSNVRKAQKLDPYEAKLKFRPEWIQIEDAINNNEKIISSGVETIPNWIFRETYVLKVIRDYINRFNKIT